MASGIVLALWHSSNVTIQCIVLTADGVSPMCTGCSMYRDHGTSQAHDLVVQYKYRGGLSIGCFFFLFLFTPFMLGMN